MDENPRIKAEEGRGCQKQGSQKRANFSQPAAQKERQKDDQRTAQRRDSTQRQDIQILKRFFSSQPSAPGGDQGKGWAVIMCGIERISSALQPPGGDFRPDRLVRVQWGARQIQKSQAHPEKKNGNPNEADSRERHFDSLLLVVAIVKRVSVFCPACMSIPAVRAAPPIDRKSATRWVFKSGK